MFTYLVFPTASDWRVQLQDGADVGSFTDFASAERRARWLAARASVQGHESEILLLAADGALVGRWQAETYTPASPLVRNVAA